MSWTTPPTFVAGDVLTAAQLNAYVRDNPLFLYTPPMCRVYNSADLAITSGVDLVLTFNSERYDTDSMHSTVANTQRLTAASAGKYAVGANVQFTANGTGIRGLYLNIESVRTIGWGRAAPAAAGLVSILNVNTQEAASAAQAFIAVVEQNSGSELNAMAATGYSPEMWAAWQGN